MILKGGIEQAFDRWETLSASAKEFVNELQIEDEKLNFKFNHTTVIIARRIKPTY